MPLKEFTALEKKSQQSIVGHDLYNAVIIPQWRWIRQAYTYGNSLKHTNYSS